MKARTPPTQYPIARTLNSLGPWWSLEIEAIKSIVGQGDGIAVGATKSATGHLLGAAGGLEAIFTILALRGQVAQPMLNLENPTLRQKASTSSPA